MGLSEQKIKQLIMEEAKKLNLIKSATIELLDYCNFYCPHCFVHNQYKAMIDKTSYKKIIDELVNMKCIWLLLTGGDVILHPDFIELYEYAYDKGFVFRMLLIFLIPFSFSPVSLQSSALEILSYSV